MLEKTTLQRPYRKLKKMVKVHHHASVLETDNDRKLLPSTVYT
jgi:hypothetical protein